MKRMTLFAALLSFILAACGRGPAAAPLTQAPPRTLTVFAAASLTASFQEIGKAFEAANPGVTVSFNFAGSQSLRTQIEQGAAADVFASADHKNIDTMVSENLIAGGAYRDIAINKLVVIMPPGNPAKMRTLQDLSKPGLKLDLADESVPVGSYARQALTSLDGDPAYGADFSTKVLANVVSNETDVKQVVSKVDLGEADAGIVYMTDALASPDLKTIAIPDEFNMIAKYPIAVLDNSSNAELGMAFVDYVLSPAGQNVLKKWGFGPVQ
jgi:molybdate transport system substrate-binding protein